MPRIELPEHLRAVAFTNEEARAAGIGRGRLRGPDLAHPFRGIHTATAAPEDLTTVCESLLSALGPQHRFSHLTAARLWGMPTPFGWSPDERLHVLAVGDTPPMRRDGVVGWETEFADGPPRMLGLLPVVDPAAVWCQLSVPGALGPGRAMSQEWLVATGDFLLSGPRGKPRGPLCTRGDLVEAAARHRGKRGNKALSWALERVRPRVDSPKESLLRVGLVEAGLPEPVVQVPVMTAEGLLHSDLGYPDARLLLEYQGDEHRVSRQRWLKDLTRVQLFEDAGYRVIAVGADDLEPDCRALARRIRRALAR